MIADLGQFAVFTSVLLAIYAAIMAYLGARRQKQAWVDSARNALIAIFPLMLVSGLTMVYSLLNNDFSLEYVWRVTSRETPTYLKVTALWGGQAGSLLFWNILLAAFTAFSHAPRLVQISPFHALCHHDYGIYPDVFPGAHRGH